MSATQLGQAWNDRSPCDSLYDEEPFWIDGPHSDSEDQRGIQQLAKTVERMEVVNPEVLRVTPVWRVLERGGESLRQKRDYFYKSEKSEEIPAFLSHSWHGEPWKKFLTLVVFYNGAVAVILGSFLAILLVLLFAWTPLPGWYHTHSNFKGYASWSLFLAVLLAALLLFFWWPQKRVFFDGICISKNNPELKAQAVTSLSGFLSRSHSMLVLWDSTWTQRMWCLFELGAFLKSINDGKQSTRKTLIIRPIFLGPVSITVFLTAIAAGIPLPMIYAPLEHQATVFLPVGAAVLLCGGAVGYVSVSYMREYFRQLDTMKQQLLSLSFDTTRCSCCDRGHVDLLGNEIICDREILKECMSAWFGSQAAFEEILRSQVLAALDNDLDERVFSTKWILGVTIPIWWSFMDYAVGDYAWSPEGAAYTLLCGTTVWLTFPSILSLMILLSKSVRAKHQNRYLDIAKNFVPLCGLAIGLTTMTGCFTFTLFFLPTDFTAMERAGVFVVCMAVYAVFSSAFMLGLKGVLKP